MPPIRVWRRFRETRLSIVTDRPDAAERCWIEALKQRVKLESYLRINPSFASSLDPVEVEPQTPEVIRRMASTGFLAGVGPMASVAGVIADMALEEGLKTGPEILVVENGGEVAVSTLVEPVDVGVYTGVEEIRGFGFRIKPQDTPLGIGSSSSKLGAGISLGEADLVTVFAENAGLADAAATAVCNMVKGEDIQETVRRALDKALKIDGVLGCIVVYRGFIGFRGWIPEVIKTPREGFRLG